MEIGAAVLHCRRRWIQNTGTVLKLKTARNRLVEETLVVSRWALCKNEYRQDYICWSCVQRLLFNIFANKYEVQYLQTEVHWTPTFASIYLYLHGNIDMSCWVEFGVYIMQFSTQPRDISNKIQTSFILETRVVYWHQRGDNVFHSPEV